MVTNHRSLPNRAELADRGTATMKHGNALIGVSMTAVLVALALAAKVPTRDRYTLKAPRCQVRIREPRDGCEAGLRFY
jgi:hypothetical protein